MSWEKAAPEYWMGRKDAYQDVLLIIKGLVKDWPDIPEKMTADTMEAWSEEYDQAVAWNAALRAVVIAVKEIDDGNDTISR